MYKKQSRRIGQYRDRISIMVPVQTSNGQGGFITTYTKLLEAWAKIEMKDGSYSYEDGQRVLMAKYTIMLKYRSDRLIPYNAIVVFGLKRFKLDGVPIKDLYGATWTLLCTEVESKEPM